MTEGYLGIDAGTQGLSVIFTDTDLKILVSGESSYEMLPGLDPECFEQQPEDWSHALQSAMSQVHQKANQQGLSLSVRAIGISGQMHGEVLANAAGDVLGPARLWCDGRNESEGHELTNKLGVKCPKRMTAVRWLWTIRNQPQKVRDVAHITTPSGWLGHQLTGDWFLGIGDAAGMFPIDQSTLSFNTRLAEQYDDIVRDVVGKNFQEEALPKIIDLMPSVRRAGEDGGCLNERGAKLLGLPKGIPVAPAEGDQPAALAGSLIAAPGQVSMSFGTSVVANSVGDRPFDGIARSIDHFCAPDGRPINMVWLRNGTTAMNMVVEMFGGNFSAIMPQVLEAPDDCNGLLALPFIDDEPGLGVTRGGTAMLIGLSDVSATPGNVVKAMLLATIFNLRLGSEDLDQQGYPRTDILLSGGLVKTPELGQLVADAFATPVTILDGAEEGTAWGAALMAKFRDEAIGNPECEWAAFLASQRSHSMQRFEVRPESAKTLSKVYVRYKHLLDAHTHLESTVGI